MNDELYHHGILGMKWGIRRYQNADGTYTELGKRMKNSGKSSQSFFSLGKKKAKKQEKEDPDKDLSTEEKKVKYAKDAKSLYKHRDLYSNSELQAAYLRLNCEKNIRNLIPADKNKVVDFIKKFTKGLNMTADAMNAGKKLYDSVQALEKAMENTKKVE